MKESLPTYSTFAEKREKFRVIKIEDNDQLEILLNKYRGKEDYIFRGVNDASYKMLTSLHRKEIEYKIHPLRAKLEVLFPLCEKISELQEIRERFFISQKGQGDKENRQSEGELMIKFGYFLLSYLQHYIPFSPFLDVTRNIDIALFFAMSGYSLSDKEETNQYISLYVINRKYIASTNSMHHVSLGHGINLETFKKSIDKFKDFYLLILSDLGSLEFIESLNGVPHIDNDNIRAQEGEFIVYKDFDAEGAEEMHKSPTTLENKARYNEPIVSLEINKRLIPEITCRYHYYELFPSLSTQLETEIKRIYAENSDRLLKSAMLPIYASQTSN